MAERAHGSPLSVAALGIDLGGTKVEAALLDDKGTVLWKQRLPTPAGDYDATVRAIAALTATARALTAAARAVPGEPDGQDGAQAAIPLSIGIGTPGTATPSGLMKNCNSTCLNGRALQADVEAAVGQRVALMNDANCLALSEATDGAGAGAPVVFAAILGTGTGAGIAVHGRVLTGPNGLAGEWGHNPLPWADAAQDPRWGCYCGRSGCIETLLSGPGLARDHALHHGGTLDAAAIAALACAGDEACSASLARHTHRLARALASVINLLDPDVIVLGGGLSLMPQLYTEVPALCPRWVFSAGAETPLKTRLLPALHGDASGVRGAAWVGRAAAQAARAAAQP